MEWRSRSRGARSAVPTSSTACDTAPRLTDTNVICKDFMKVYRVRPEVNKFQYFMLEDETLELSDMMTFDGSSGKTEIWVPPSVYIFKPKHQIGNFFALWGTDTL